MPNRGQSAGFQFGGGADKGTKQGAGQKKAQPAAAAAPAVPEGPEREVAAQLAAAQRAGPDTLKGVLKQLLLKWHPDKAPQGDDQDAVRKREEATRVFRFVVQERERLGI